MAGLEGLTSLIYHERQQEGSMLCAQHALNSLLQGNYFTAPDLANIARTIDGMEHERMDDAPEGSANMDDTGFFSIQVIEQALQIWGLNTVRWRSEEMRPYQEHPQNQLAFILNLKQHWFTLRRFGPAATSPDNDPGTGHWYNLDSSLNSPQWVGKMYLGMVIKQMEEEGYSVFAIVQSDPSKELALPRVDADAVAETLASPRFSGGNLPSSAGPSETSSSQEVQQAPSTEEFQVPPDLADEDMELQAALQASLNGGNYEGFDLPRPPLPRPSPPMRAVPPPMPNWATRPSIPGSLGDADDHDPVAASMQRQRAMLERMQREQAEALREGYEDEIGQLFSHFGRPQPPREAAGDEDEAEAIRRAVEESRGDPGPESSVEVEDPETNADVPREQPYTGFGVLDEHRVYDDDDAELQAALKASLEHAPAGFTFPASPPPVRREIPSTSTSERISPTTSGSSGATSTTATSETLDGDTEDSEMSEVPEPDEPQQPTPVLDRDEIRRRRLEKFGA